MTASELTQSVVNAVNDVGVFETGGASKGHRNRNLLFLYPLSESPKTVGEWNHEPLQTTKELWQDLQLWIMFSHVFFVDLGVLGLLKTLIELRQHIIRETQAPRKESNKGSRRAIWRRHQDPQSHSFADSGQNEHNMADICCSYL